MAPNGRPLSAFIGIFFLLVLNSSPCYSVQSDIECLKEIHESLRDPLKYFSSWNFENKTEGSICRFTGIECWHPDESKVLNIKLSDMELEGEFPQGIRKCSSLTGLDLSSNKLHGPIPSNVSGFLEYVTNLDLSSNQFSGEIPAAFVNCTYLNVLKLDNNQLTGQIPGVIGQLGRLKSFSVANNRLTGQVPTFANGAVEVNYENNAGLCGGSLSPCKGPTKKTHVGIIVGAAVGG